MMNDSLTNTKRCGKAIMHCNSDQKRVINQMQVYRVVTLYESICYTSALLNRTWFCSKGLMACNCGEIFISKLTLIPLPNLCKIMLVQKI